MKIEFDKLDEYIIIIGCGRLGASIANTLSERNKNVTIIDVDKNSFRKLSSSFGGLALEGNGTDIDILNEARISQCSVMVMVTDNDNTNIMIAQMAKEMFKVNKVIARLYDSERECVYKEFNIDTILPSVLSVNEVNKVLKMK